MLALSFGIVAALAWGLHDLCVRYVSQNTGILPPLSIVLGVGTLILLLVSLMFGHWQNMTPEAYSLSVASGLAFLAASIGLYKAFGIGPVPLVAPIIGAFPILSFLWAAYSGQEVLLGQWGALVCVVCGVAVVSLMSDETDSNGSRRSAILWSVTASVAFALTFALGQAATAVGDELSAGLVTRAVATAGVIGLLFIRQGPKQAPRSTWPILVLMALLDTVAMGVVLAAGSFDRPEFAVVAASVFGVVTIILARIFFQEYVKPSQWIGVALAFGGIGYLAF